MKNQIKYIISIFFLLSVQAFGQSAIEGGVEFFPRPNKELVNIQPLAFFKHNHRFSSENSMFFNKVYIDHSNLNIISVLNSGLTYSVKFKIFELEYPNRLVEIDSYDGLMHLSNCVRKDGKDVFGTFNSLEDVLKYSKDQKDRVAFSSCTFRSDLLTGKTPLSTGNNPFPIIKNFELTVLPTHMNAKMNTGNVIVSDYKTFSDFIFENLFYSNDQKTTKVVNKAEIIEERVEPKPTKGSSRSSSKISKVNVVDTSEQIDPIAAGRAALSQARKTTLNILNTALDILQTESEDRQLPKTVAYLMENRSNLNTALRLLTNHTLNIFDLIEFSVSVKNAFHILDQAVGLASDRRIDMKQLILENQM